MKKLAALFALSLLVSGCGGGDSSESTSNPASPVDGAGNQNTQGDQSASLASGFLIKSVSSNPQISAQCGAAGGVAIYQGQDKNNNGVLDANEYFDSTAANPNPQIICHGQAANQPLFEKQVLSAGDACRYGGYLINLGYDSNQNQQLDPTEVVSSLPVCSPFSDASVIDAEIQAATIKGQLPAELVAVLSADAIYHPKQVTSRSGNLWLTPDAIASAIESDIERRSRTVVPPMTRATQVKINQDGSYQVENLPAGAGYSLIFIDSANAGTKISGIQLRPGETRTQNITVNDLRENGKVRLKVQSLLTGQTIPVVSARLHALDEMFFSDEQGEIVIEGLPAAHYAMTLKADNYVSRYLTFQVESGKQTDLQSVELNHQMGSLAGSVNLVGLSDFSHVLVYAKSQDGSVYTSLTNSFGTYRFNALPVGEGYSVIATASGYQTTKIDNLNVSLNKTMIASPMSLASLQPETGVIEGYAQFMGRDSFEHAGIIVSVEGTDLEAITARDGSFVLNNLPSGEYTLNFSDSNHKTFTKTVEVITSAANRLAPVELAPVIGGVKGLVHNEAGHPVASAQVLLQTPSSTHAGFTDEEGRFELQGVLTGRHTLRIAKEGYGAVEQMVLIESNQTGDLSAEPLVLNRLVLHGQIQLSDDQEASGVSVLLVGTDVPVAITDDEGRFTLFGVSRGQYRLQANKVGYGNYLEIVSVTQTPSSLDEVITLHPLVGSMAGVLDLPEAFGAADNLSVTLMDMAGNVVAQSAVLADGSYFLTNLSPSDQYILRVNGTDEFGNTINVINQPGLAVEANKQTQVESQFAVTLVDPNPPVFQSVQLTETLAKNIFNHYIINPSIYTRLPNGDRVLTQPQFINLSAAATDLDGDPIRYTFSTDRGEIVFSETNQARWLAPEEGGLALIQVIATSRNRSAIYSLEVAVNHYADITFLAPDQFAVPEPGQPYLASSLTLNEFRVRADDLEDAVLTGESIRWYSTLAGFLGSGDTLRTTLRPGSHGIYVEATDSNGLTSTSELMPAEINVPDQILLKVPGIDIDFNQLPMRDHFVLDIQAGDLTLDYESSNPIVASINAAGRIDALTSGTAIITVASVELDENQAPFYSTEMVVRVVDLVADNTQQTVLGVNEIKEIHLTATANQRPFIFPPLDRGDYVLVLFDKQDVVLNSQFESQVKLATSNLSTLQTTADRQVIHSFSIPQAGTQPELFLKSRHAEDNAVVKAALFPGVNVRNIDGFIEQSYWDQRFEPNDAPAIAYPLTLQETVYSSLTTQEMFDFYSIEVEEGRSYTLSFVNNKTSKGNVRVGVGHATDLVAYVANTEVAADRRLDVDFVATINGRALIRLEGRTRFTDYQYQLTVLPSFDDGLKQDPKTFEPNNTIKTSTSIKVGETITTKLEMNEVFDYFGFEAVQGKTYTIEVDNKGTSAGDLSYRVGTSTSLDSYIKATDIAKSRKSVLSFTATDTGRTVVRFEGRVYWSNPGHYHNYDYSFRVLPSVEDGLIHDPITHEPNDAVALAYPVEIGESITSKLSADEFYDYFSFEAEAGKSYTIEVDNKGTSAGDLSYRVGTSTSLDSYIKATDIAKSRKSVLSFTATDTGRTVVRFEGRVYWSNPGHYHNYDYTFTITE